jgi:hypothetical protein
MNKVAINKLRRLCKDMKLADEDELADKLLCALAALTGSENPKAHLSYSYCLRYLRNNHPDRVREFQIMFKKAFDDALDEDLENPENIALTSAIKDIGIEFE